MPRNIRYNLRDSFLKECQVPSRKSQEIRPESNLAEAAEKTSLVIRGLQSRLQPRFQPPPERPIDESPEDLERQLEQYFSKALVDVPGPTTTVLAEVRSRVIEGVADRILRHWEQGSALQNAIIERLIERLLDRFGAPLQ